MKMIKKVSYYCFILLLLSIPLDSLGQDNTYNPYERFGEKIDILTLSNGQFDEFFDLDSVEIIGSAVLNTNTMQVIGFIEIDTIYSEATLEPEIVSRWMSPDPMAAIYPMDSPYMFAGNTPVMAIDVDGLYKYPVTVNYNGHRYELEFNSNNTQKVKIRLADEGKAKEAWQTIEYSTRDSYRMSKGVKSIGLLKSYTANTIAQPGGDVDIMDEKFYWPGAGFSVKPLEVIKAAIDADNGLGLSIFGGHNIDGMHPNSRGDNDHAFRIENIMIMNGLNILILPVMKTYWDDPWYANDPFDFEDKFNQMRAQTVQNEFFADVNNVNATSIQRAPSRAVGSITLPAYNHDPVGITMNFDFDRPVRTNNFWNIFKPKPKPVQKSKNPRFL